VHVLGHNIAFENTVTESQAHNCMHMQAPALVPAVC